VVQGNQGQIDAQENGVQDKPLNAGQQEIDEQIIIIDSITRDDT
jgi:hypothetical protein